MFNSALATQDWARLSDKAAGAVAASTQTRNATASILPVVVAPTVMMDDELDQILKGQHRAASDISLLGQYFISLSGKINFGLKATSKL